MIRLNWLLESVHNLLEFNVLPYDYEILFKDWIPIVFVVLLRIHN